jgi:hypothetical protein
MAKVQTRRTVSINRSMAALVEHLICEHTGCTRPERDFFTVWSADRKRWVKP